MAASRAKKNKKRKAGDCDLLAQVALLKRARISDENKKGAAVQCQKWNLLEGESGKEIAKVTRGNWLSSEMKKAFISYQKSLLIHGRCASSCYNSLKLVTEAVDGMKDEPICVAEIDIFTGAGATMREIADLLTSAFGRGSASWSIRGTGNLFDADDDAHVDRLAVEGTSLCLVLSIYPSLKAFPFLSLDGSVRELTTVERSERSLWQLVSQRSSWPMAEDHEQVLMDVSFVIARVSDEQPSSGGAGSSSNNLNKYTVNACSIGFPAGIAFENVERAGVTAGAIAEKMGEDAVYVVGTLDFVDTELQGMQQLILDPYPHFHLESQAIAFASLFTVADEYVEGTDGAVESRIKSGIEMAVHHPEMARIVVAMYGSQVVGLDISKLERYRNEDSWEKMFVGVLKGHRGRGLSHAMIDCFESTLVEKPGYGTRMTVTVPSCLVGEGERFWTGERGRGFVTMKQKGKKQTAIMTGHSHSEEQRLSRARRRQWPILDANGWADRRAVA